MLLEKVTNYVFMLFLDGMMFPPKMVNISEIIPDLTWMGMRPMQ
jgi:hypothetical protein